jgi:hypothetical protein
MSLADAADVMGVHVNTVRNMIRRGDLTVLARVRRQGSYGYALDPREVRAAAIGRHPSQHLSNRETPARVGSGSSTSTTPHGRPNLTAVAGSGSA